MGVIKKKPYEISVWEDRLVTENDISYYKETKIAVIGSDKMESPNRVFDPVLIENVNGEKTLTFSLAYKYFDEYKGELITNPFYGYLINERKIKLFYNDEWNEFVIKECEESSEENIFKYTAKELFSLELAKLGYNVTLDTELNNNQGTIIELAKKVLQNTDWQVDEDNSDLLTQYVQEPLYKVIVELPEGEETLEVLNLDTNELIEINNNETLYVFYSFINNKEVNNVQFIREADRTNFFIDDDNVIKSTNYRFTQPIQYTVDEQTGQVTGITNVGTIDSIYLSNQGYRLVYKILTTYDPIMDRTVEVYQMPYKDGVQEVYHFLDYNYTTSDIVVSYITNGSNFELFEDGKIQGWYNTTPTYSSSGAPVLQPISTTTYPELAATANLQLLDTLSELNGYIELKFDYTLTQNYENTYFNEGFEHSTSIIDHISSGEKFVLRTRYYTSETKHGELIEGNPVNADGGLRVIVAQYETVEQECYLNEEAREKSQVSKIKSYKILPNEIILDFDEGFIRSPNLINNGIFESENRKQYIVDNVVQVPSTAYIYKTAGDETEYIWDCKQEKYVDRAEKREDLKFADYYYTTATAKCSLTNEQLSDPTLRIGVFLYTKDSNIVDKYIYLQDIQLTRYYEDGNNNPVIIGNAPLAVTQEANKFYLKPTTQLSEKEINTFGSLEALADELGVDVNTITPIFNEESQKILTIQAKQSNYFNILQDLCEKFECWLDIKVSHEEDGSISLDKNFNPIKKIAFKEYAGKDNFAGFKNGINLTGITRNIDSNEIVTKLIVDPVQSEYTDTGSVEIQKAKSNFGGQSYILNFSYYLNRGLITETQEDFNNALYTYNSQFDTLNKSIFNKQDELAQLSNSLTKIIAQRNTYTALIDEAQRNYNKAIEDFQKLTNWEYETFVAEYQNLEGWAIKEPDKAKNYLENDTILDVVGQIYVSTITINNYTGILTNLNKEYQDLKLKLDGAKEYGVSVTFIPGNGIDINPSTTVVVDDYVTGLQFQLLDINKSPVVYDVNPNERIFNVSNAAPYQYISFIGLPEHYRLKYFSKNKAHILDRDKAARNFKIYDDVTEETYSRRFVLIPEEDYAQEHKGIQQEIDELIEQKEQLEKEFYKKYSRFLQEGTWSSQDYTDNELYYFDALQVSDTSAQPKVSYTINVLEVSQIDGLENYDFRVGDKTYIEDTDFFGYLYQTATVQDSVENEPPVVITTRTPVREEVVVSEIEWHFDEPDNNVITIQNYKTRFEDLFQRISATVQTVQRNEITYPKTSSILDQSGLINSNLLADSLNGIGGVGFALTTNGSVQATQDGLLIRDLLNPANMMRLASTGLQVSTDGGANWGTAISAEGISTDILTAGTINTQQIWLMDGDNPSFRWDKAGLNAYGLDENGNDSYDLKTYVRFDKYGLYGIKNDEDYVASSLDDVRNKAFFGITWDGFFIKNSYTNGEVSITSDDDFVVKQGNIKRIKIGAIEHDDTGAPTKYGINIRNDNNEVVFDTGDDGNLTVSGTINALAGNFTGQVNVGDPNNTHIIIDGSTDNPTISSSNYSDGAGTGWIINSEGDATFSNVSVRGAIKTAVFEYEEIQAVGGAFLFRPSSTIKTAKYTPVDNPTEEIDEDGDTHIIDYYYYDDITGEKIYSDLIVTVEKPLMFTKGNWVKISNYNSLGVNPEDDLTTYGLVHVYEISDITMPIVPVSGDDDEGEPENNNTVSDSNIGEDSSEEEYNAYEITLRGGAAIFEETTLDNVAGGALIDFGKTVDDEHYDHGVHNYGIGINSSDNYVNLPARAISLFETTIHPDEESKVTYNYRGILGTLPRLPLDEIESSIYIDNMVGTQGIYTDNMYIGDKSQYMSFYTKQPYYEKTKDTEIDENKDYYIQDVITGTYILVDEPSPDDLDIYYEYIINDKNLVIRAKKIQYQAADGSYATVGDPAPYIWFDNTGAHVAGGIQGTTFVSENPNTYGFNTWMNQNSAAFKYNALDLTKINTDGLYLYGAPYDNNGTYIQNSEQIALTNNGLDIYRPGIFDTISETVNQGTKAVSVDDEGLKVYNTNGQLIAKYGDVIKLGRTDENDNFSGIEITSDEIGFFSSNNKTAYVNNQKLYIPYSVVLNEMIVGTREYELTEDTTVISGKNYYRKENNIYVLVTNPSGNPKQQGYYEKLENATDLWAWKVTNDEHLRLVWKGGNVEVEGV